MTSYVHASTWNPTCGHSSLVDHVVALFLPQLLDSGETGNIDGGLTADSGIQLLLGPLSADFEEIISEDFAGPVEKLLGLGNILDELSRHANILSSLSGEQESSGRLPVVEVAIGHHAKSKRPHIAGGAHSRQIPGEHVRGSGHEGLAASKVHHAQE